MTNESIVCLCIAVFVFSFGAVATLIDLWLSRTTLRIELETALVNAKCQRVRLDSRNTDAVIHFNRLFHELWYNDGLGELLASSSPQKQASEVEGLVLRYYGLHQEQYYFFTHGLLPRDIYQQWLEFMRYQMDRIPGGGTATMGKLCGALIEKESDGSFRKHIKCVVSTEEAISDILDRLESALQDESNHAQQLKSPRAIL